MCTMTWFQTNNGYELFFNRDEQRSRLPAYPPSVHLKDNVQYIAPIDADAGGTWISVNQFGLTVCLLNHYQFQQISTYKDWVSRGEIVRLFSDIQSLEEVQSKFNAIDLSNYRAFRMLLMNRQAENCFCIWDGHEPRIEVNVTCPKSSSSIKAEYVKSLRKGYYADLQLALEPKREQHYQFHLSHWPTKSHKSVCMHCETASTVSLSHIVVDADSASFAYADGAPCEVALEQIEAIKLHSPSLKATAR